MFSARTSLSDASALLKPGWDTRGREHFWAPKPVTNTSSYKITIGIQIFFKFKFKIKLGGKFSLKSKFLR